MNNGYEEFQQIMANIEYFKKNGRPNPFNIKDKDGHNIFEGFNFAPGSGGFGL